MNQVQIYNTKYYKQKTLPIFITLNLNEIKT